MNSDQINKSWKLNIQTDENGDGIIEFPSDFPEITGWQEGDQIHWIDRGDGSWEIKKKETELVLVETVQTFRHRYVIEVPSGKTDWALDTVTMGEAKEFSQKHLNETIVSHRTIDNDEVLQLCDQDNDYCQGWDDDLKFEAFVTELEENTEEIPTNE
jgi:hypothetical protein